MRPTIKPQVTWGTNPGQVVPIDGTIPTPTTSKTRTRATAQRALEYMDLEAGTPMRTSRSTRCSSARAPTADRGSPSRGRRVRRAAGRRRRARAGRARQHRSGSPGRERGARRDLHRRRLRLARAGLLDVPGDEPRQARSPASGAPRPQPQLRGPPGPGGRTHLVSPARAAAGHRVETPARSVTPADLEREAHHESCRSHHRDRGPARRAPTSTPTRSSPSDWLKQVERTGFEKGLFSAWRDDRTSCSTRSSTAAPTSSIGAGSSGTARP